MNVRIVSIMTVVFVAVLTAACSSTTPAPNAVPTVSPSRAPVVSTAVPKPAPTVSSKIPSDLFGKSPREMYDGAFDATPEIQQKFKTSPIGTPIPFPAPIPNESTKEWTVVRIQPVSENEKNSMEMIPVALGGTLVMQAPAPQAKIVGLVFLGGVATYYIMVHASAPGVVMPKALPQVPSVPDHIRNNEKGQLTQLVKEAIWVTFWNSFFGGKKPNCYTRLSDGAILALIMEAEVRKTTGKIYKGVAVLLKSYNPTAMAGWELDENGNLVDANWQDFIRIKCPDNLPALVTQ